jgi:hypothetical protein
MTEPTPLTACRLPGPTAASGSSVSTLESLSHHRYGRVAVIGLTHRERVGSIESQGATMAVKRRIVFIPFPKNNAGDWDQSAGGAGVSWDADRYTFVWVDDLASTNKPFAFTDDTSDTQIYVAGHGGEGAVHIENKHKGGIKVDADMVVGFLIAGDLPKSFSGKIKFYNCESAMNNGTTDTSFACKCASLLAKKGYKKAHFFGYRSSVSTGYEDYLNPKNMSRDGRHRLAIRHVNLGNNQVVTSTLGRASEFRNEIVVKKKGLFSDEYTLVIK